MIGVALRGRAWIVGGIMIVSLVFLCGRAIDQWTGGKNYTRVGEVHVVGYPVKAIVYVDTTRVLEIKGMVNLKEVDLLIGYSATGMSFYAQKCLDFGKDFWLRFANPENATAGRGTR